jgi:RimJ/RimL family protein N-acetyltransferase
MTMPPTSFPTDLALFAEGLELSRPKASDVELLVYACQDPDIVRFTHVPSPYTTEHAQDYVAICEQAARSGTSLGLLARDRDGRMLASCGPVSVDWTDRAAEVGYWVAPWARRSKVATHAMQAVCQFAFASAGIQRLTLKAAAINVASNRVAQRVGFTHEGTLRKAMADRSTRHTAGARFDVNVWGLLPEERL